MIEGRARSTAFLPHLTDALGWGKPPVMTNEQKIDDWVDVITRFNKSNGSAWTARFLLNGAWLVERAVEELEGIGATIGPNGPDLEYVVRFSAPAVREVVSVLVEQGAWLCARQELVPPG